MRKQSPMRSMYCRGCRYLGRWKAKSQSEAAEEDHQPGSEWIPKRYQQDRYQRRIGPVGADRWLKIEFAKWEVNWLQ